MVRKKVIFKGLFGLRCSFQLVSWHLELFYSISAVSSKNICIPRGLWHPVQTEWWNLRRRPVVMLKCLVMLWPVTCLNSLKFDHNNWNICSFWVTIIIIITIIARYFDNFSGYLEIFGRYSEHFLRISGNIFRPFFEKQNLCLSLPAGCSVCRVPPDNLHRGS